MSYSTWIVWAAAVVAGAQGPASPEITASELRATVAFLAADEQAGRLTGTPECARAGEYLGRALERAGVKPLGDDGTFFDHLPMHEVRYESRPNLSALSASGDGAWSGREWSVDFEDLQGSPSAGELTVVTAKSAADLPAPDPKLGREHLALLLDLPARERREIVRQIEAQKSRFGLLLVAGSATPGKPTSLEIPRPDRSTDSSEPAAASIRVRGTLLSDLRAGLVKKLRLEVEASVHELRAFNVVGVIPGKGTPARPELAKEVVVFSAHYDHIGVKPVPATSRQQPKAAGEQLDLVQNGADDDASGCAAVLELAQALAAAPPPARTLVFFFATGEELGLVGTHAFLRAPPFELSQFVCNLNFEMLGRPDPKAGGAGGLWLTGDERSNLGAMFRELGARVVADPYPEQRFFERSDSIAFAHKGIVGQTLSSYNLHKDYHEVSDEADTLDFEHMQAAVEAALVCARALADGTLAPAWTEGGKPEPR